METLTKRRHVLREDQRGFTLVEVMVTIMIMGILLAIATSTYGRVVESRRLDSATNQLISDMRLSHSKATNRLDPQTVTLTADSSEYTVTGAASPRDLDDSGEDLVSVDTAVAITFNANGSATAAPTGVSSVRVEATSNPSNCRTVQFNNITSRVAVAPCS